MKIKILPFLLSFLIFFFFSDLRAQIRKEYIEREFAACSFNQLIAKSQRGSINKKLETIEIFDFFGHRTFYQINELTVIRCYIIEPGLDSVVEYNGSYQSSTDSLMIDTFLKGGKTKESVLEYDTPCLDCPAVSHVVYKIRRRRCPKVISSTIIIHSY